MTKNHKFISCLQPGGFSNFFNLKKSDKNFAENLHVTLEKHVFPKLLSIVFAK